MTAGASSPRRARPCTSPCCWTGATPRTCPAAPCGGSSTTTAPASSTTCPGTWRRTRAASPPGSWCRRGCRAPSPAPSWSRTGPFGVIFLSSRESRAYTPYHVQLWMAIAERLAQAVEKVWRIEQLQAANQAYTEMLAFVSHELKNPIASMMTDARVLADGYLGPLDDRPRAQAGTPDGQGRLPPGAGPGVPGPGPHGRRRPGAAARGLSAFIEEVVEPALDLVQPQLQARRMVLERHYPDGPGPVQCDPDLLQIVLVNLLGNAVKYGLDGGLVRVTAGTAGWRAGGDVWNQGPGLSRPRSARACSASSAACRRPSSGAQGHRGGPLHLLAHRQPAPGAHGRPERAGEVGGVQHGDSRSRCRRTNTELSGPALRPSVPLAWQSASGPPDSLEVGAQRHFAKPTGVVPTLYRWATGGPERPRPG